MSKNNCIYIVSLVSKLYCFYANTNVADCGSVALENAEEIMKEMPRSYKALGKNR